MEVGEKLKGVIVETRIGLSPWIRFGDLTLLLFVGRVEVCYKYEGLKRSIKKKKNYEGLKRCS